MSAVTTEYDKMNKNVLSTECTSRGINIHNLNRSALIKALQEDDSRRKQNLGELGAEEVSTTPELSGSETASRDGHTETDPEMPLLVPSTSQHEQASHRLPGTSMDTQMQEMLQSVRERDTALYLQFLERQAEREAAERQAERQAEREAAERRAAADREAAQREADRRHELEMARLQQQRQTQNLGSLEHRDAPLPVSPTAKFPVMERDSDIDVYLLSFEKTCRQYHLPQAQWARYLTPGLRGKALDAYVELSEGLDDDYEAIKAAIVQKYQLTPEVYRKRFRSLQKGPGDSYMEVVSRLRTTFWQWTKGLKADTFESLGDLMIADQLLHLCPTDVRQYVLERKPISSKAAAELADTYVSTRVSDHRKSPPNVWKGGRSPMATPPSPVSQGAQQPTPAVTGAIPISTDVRRCYICGKPGHLRTHCPEQKKLTSPGQPASNPSSVLFVRQKAWVTTANLQQVTVGNRTVTGFRDTGSDLTLVKPGVISRRDIIPGKFFSLTGVGGTLSRVPRAYVFLDWGAGSGMREVGVSDEIPTDVLLGADLGTLCSYYASTKSTQDAPTELSGPTKVLCTDVGVMSDEPVDGQRDGAGEGEVWGLPVPRDGKGTPLHVPIADACVVQNVITKCNEVLLLKVDPSAGRVKERQSLAAEPRGDPDGPSPGSDPVDSASVTSQQLSLCVTDGLADPCSPTAQPALLTQEAFTAACSPAEQGKQMLDNEQITVTDLKAGRVNKLLSVLSQSERTGMHVCDLVCQDPFEARDTGAGKKHKSLWPSLIHTHHFSLEPVITSDSTPKWEQIGALVDGVADTQGEGSDIQFQLSSPLQVPMRPAVLTACRVRVMEDPERTHHGVHEVDDGAYPPLTPTPHLVSPEVQTGGASNIEGMTQTGVIRGAWTARTFPVVLIPKENQTTRLPEVLRMLNVRPAVEAFPMPRNHEVSGQLAGARCLTVIDLSWGCGPPSLTRKAQDESAFSTPCGLPAVTAMPVGVEKTPVTSQEVMDGLPGGVALWAETCLKGFKGLGFVWVKHLALLSAVPNNLTEPNLTVPSPNCQGGMSEARDWEPQGEVGTQVSRAEEVEASMAWLAPQAKLLDRSFLGTAGYSRMRECNSSGPAESMTDLLNGEQMNRVSLMPVGKDSCAILTKVLTGAPGTGTPEVHCPILVSTDATTFGSGEAQGQRGELTEEDLTFYPGKKAPSRQFTGDFLQGICLVIGWAPRKLPWYSKVCSRLVLQPGQLIRPPEGGHLGEVGSWGSQSSGQQWVASGGKLWFPPMQPPEGGGVMIFQLGLTGSQTPSCSESAILTRNSPHSLPLPSLMEYLRALKTVICSFIAPVVNHGPGCCFKAADLRHTTTIAAQRLNRPHS